MSFSIMRGWELAWERSRECAYLHHDDMDWVVIIKDRYVERTRLEMHKHSQRGFSESSVETPREAGERWEAEMRVRALARRWLTELFLDSTYTDWWLEWLEAVAHVKRLQSAIRARRQASIPHPTRCRSSGIGI